MLTRIISAIVLMTVSIFAMYKGGIYFFAFVMLFNVGALYEYYFNIVKRKNIEVLDQEKKSEIIDGLSKTVSIVTGLFIVVSSYYKTKFNVDYLDLFALYIIVLFLIQIFRNNVDEVIYTVSFSVTGVIYISVLSTYFIKVRDLKQGFFMLISFLIMNWSNDSGAYFTGVKFGKTKLCPKISPKKSVEGLFGGIASTFIFGFLVKCFLIKEALTSMQVVIIALIISLICPLGDLAQSLIKRNFKVKDSSNLIPGHGGILDRIDSLIFVLPSVYLYLKYFTDVIK